MIELQDDRLVITFPEVHPRARCTIDFQRTLRIPDDNREYPLPPGLGSFPLFHVDDYAERLPKPWQRHGGAFLPMHQAEALWLNFSGNYPMAIKIAAGKINAVTGDDWTNELSVDPQDYVVLPDQPWLDGFCIGEGQVRQFVAMPLGQGYTAEEQLTGAAEHGGLQIVAYPMLASAYEEFRSRHAAPRVMFSRAPDVDFCRAPGDDLSLEMDLGLAPGGLMRQKIYDDPHAFDVWDTSVRARCFMHLLNSSQFQAVTGHPPPTQPPSARTYSDAGLPWFELYGEDQKALQGASKLAGLDSVAARALKQGHGPIADNEAVERPRVQGIRRTASVRDGEF
ncbi:MAG: hypothetical protein V2J02_12435 [Pseudomonadales bacterium]|jgi:hypothetical protein|nr:hypothetical protein [Pseudomonadales bacterium]